MSETEREHASSAPRQEIYVESGFAAVAIGADLHVFGDNLPVYVLEPWPAVSAPPALSPPSAPARPSLPPSRLLDARLAVVPFTGREDQFRELWRWLDQAPRLAIRWLYAPGGQGKTRLAMRLCDEAAAAGWKVLIAAQGPGRVQPGLDGHDLSPEGHRGLLAVVDYADEWPLTHLTWLLSNRVFHWSAIRTRILMVARSADVLPTLRAAVRDPDVDVSAQFLPPLPEADGGRDEMFGVARDSFAAHYGLADTSAVTPPRPLDDPELGLVLAIHMAALVAVDARFGSEPVPENLAGLSCYLLDREFLYWQQLFGDLEYEINPGERAYRTPPADMHRAVYAAALTGPVPRNVGRGVAITARPYGDPEQLLHDHRICYPPASFSRDTVLEPLFPDLLAEDFLALTIPGHDASYQAQEWAAPAATALLARVGEGQEPAAWTPRAVTFLASATYRWPHLGERYLFGLLQGDPQLALDAGSAALSALAVLPGAPTGLLESIESRFPADRHADLDPGIAAVTRRLTAARLTAISEPKARAVLHATLATRLSYAGLHEEAATAERLAAAIYRDLAMAQPEAFGRHLAGVLGNLGSHLAALGQRDQALEAHGEAVAICRQLVGDQSQAANFDYDLAHALAGLGSRLRDVGRHAEAMEATGQAVAILRRLAAADVRTVEPDLALALSNLGVHLAAVGKTAESLEPLQQAVAIRRRLAAAEPATYQPSLASSLTSLANRLQDLWRPAEALRTGQEAVQIYRRLAAVSPVAFDRELGRAVANLAVYLAALGQQQDALAATQEAVVIRRRLAAANPAAGEPDLGFSLHNLANHLAAVGRKEEALAASREAVTIRRRLATGSPGAFERDLAVSLSDLSVDLGSLGHTAEAVEAEREAVAIRRRMAAAMPAVFERDLAVSLSNLGISLRELGEYAEGADVTMQALEIYQRLATSDAPRFDPDVALCLSNIGHCQWGLGQLAQALDALGRSADVRRQLAIADHGRFAPELARSLSNLGTYLLMAGRRRQAAAAIAEAMRVYSRLVKQYPGRYEERLKELQEAQREML
jgi:tetratricopeptide (TPR) repeat protein